ncbi:MAG: glucose-6-phosphate isomerase [Phycisphaerales bacterium]|nr:glucose-6-phosphate isomerase [Phycisphaerales bacterium]MCB9863192.1 glucose-6-phosphate isomerase [Phycisphaerales bacterium]
MTKTELWNRYQEHLCICESIDLTLDVSRMAFSYDFLDTMAPAMAAAFDDMDALERGAIANPDEQRMVGHYWLRAPQLAPDRELTAAIQETTARIKAFATDIHTGKIKPQQSAKFSRILSIGIGGSALGPMFVSDALGDPASDKMKVHFIDNTDPDGCDRTLRAIGSELSETLTLVISKSGSTPESRNGMLAAAAAYKAAGLDFARHAVAITGEGSHLDEQAKSQEWLATFPMWDWVGGRTSELSAVGLVPAALQGIDIDAMLAGAAACDEVTRRHAVRDNPAALMALMWNHATRGKGEKDMVVLPYKDRLLLFSRYLQQLVMESLGKRLNLNGERVDQGIAVYGNKGSTDQHAYVQQLRDGVNNFFVVFIRVLNDGGETVYVEPGITAGDYLHGFLMGTREALFSNDRESMTITVPNVDARVVGVLIALFERAVGFYASLIGINAYHQPGVEAGKKAATAVLSLQTRVASELSRQPRKASEIAAAIGREEDAETIFSLLEHLAANGRATQFNGRNPATATFSVGG